MATSVYASPVKKKTPSELALLAQRASFDPDRFFDWLGTEDSFSSGRRTFLFLSLGCILCRGRGLPGANWSSLIGYFPRALRWETLGPGAGFTLVAVTFCHEFRPRVGRANIMAAGCMKLASCSSS